MINSQHPLETNPASQKRERPGTEYRTRLEHGLELAADWTKQGRTVRVITLGDLHHDDAGAPDSCTLAQAGQRYLLERGMPKAQLLTAESLKQHQLVPDDGIYCTEDEVAVAAQIFKQDPRLAMVVAVCGQAQAQRVMLAAQNYQVPLQMSIPLVYEGTALANPAYFHHQPDVETVRINPIGVAYPQDRQPFRRLREAAKAQRRL